MAEGSTSATSLASELAARKMNKFERIRLLEFLGLNTEVSVLVEDIVDLKKHSAFLGRLDSMSVRTFAASAEPTFEPHFPIVSQPEFEATCLPLLDQGLSLIVAEPIDPVDAVLAGCVAHERQGFVIEVALGPGTVRRVTRDGRVDRAWRVSSPNDLAADPEIGSVLEKVVAVEQTWSQDISLVPVLYEMSIYKNAVGTRREHIIFWEIQGLDGHDSELERFYREVVDR